MEIVVYGSKLCSHCIEFSKYLKQKGILDKHNVTLYVNLTSDELRKIITKNNLPSEIPFTKVDGKWMTKQQFIELFEGELEDDYC